ncbi:MAG: alpha/beta hydrolase [Thermoplasmata archaeon]|nr:alpha/beta hydrolase [Thermoplasmata archaeon]
MRVTTNGISTYYEVRGKKGPAIIMLHGNGEDHTIFDRAVDYLEQKFVVYLVDSRGHGESSPPVNGEYHYQDLADDLEAFIRKLEIREPIIIGFSDGAISALLFASQHPEVPSRIFACGANTRPETLKGMGMALLKARKKDDPRVKMMLTEPNITADELSKITCPVLVVAGSRDCVKREDSEFIANSVQDGTLCIMKRADHSSYIVHSTRIVDAVFRECNVDPESVQVVYRFAR